MGFITEQMVSDALAYLAIEPHPVAIAKGELTKAENDKKIMRAHGFLANGGSVAERQAEAECSPAYATACQNEVRATEQYEHARAKINWANTTIETWRTENANQRAAERLR